MKTNTIKQTSKNTKPKNMEKCTIIKTCWKINKIKINLFKNKRSKRKTNLKI